MGDKLVCPQCGEDDIYLGSVIGSKVFEKEKCYREFKRAYCRICGAKLVYVVTYNRSEGSEVLIPRESMKSEYGTGFGKFAGRWA